MEDTKLITETLDYESNVVGRRPQWVEAGL